MKTIAVSLPDNPQVILVENVSRVLAGLIILITLVLFSQNLRAQAAEDSTAIKAAALNYIEGWYSGDVERMDQALHPNLTKRSIQQLPATQRDLMVTLWKTDMVEYTRAGFGKKQAVEGQTNEVEILDIFKNIANVKCTSKDYVDYLQIGKVDGEWKIINVLWAMNN